MRRLMFACMLVLFAASLIRAVEGRLVVLSRPTTPEELWAIVGGEDQCPRMESHQCGPKSYCKSNDCEFQEGKNPGELSKYVCEKTITKGVFDSLDYYYECYSDAKSSPAEYCVNPEEMPCWKLAPCGDECEKKKYGEEYKYECVPIESQYVWDGWLWYSWWEGDDGCESGSSGQ